MKKRFLIGIIFVFICLDIAFAQITVTKTAASYVYSGQNLFIDINIYNSGQTVSDAYVSEIIYGDPVYPAEYTQIIPTGDTIANSPPYYEWNLQLFHGSNRITYVIRPVNPGELIIGSTKVAINDNYYESNIVEVNVSCNKNNICEQDKLEDFNNCPEDCPSGSNDSYCDMEPDGIEDPDCDPGTDIVSSSYYDSCHNDILDFGEEFTDCGDICENPCGDEHICNPCMRFNGIDYDILWCNLDGQCDYLEKYNEDCSDCDFVSEPVCGDDYCGPAEHKLMAGNRVIIEGCTADCAQYSCGDRICDPDYENRGCSDCISDTPICGDGYIDYPEECDINAPIPSCQDIGFVSGTTSCIISDYYMPPEGYTNCTCFDRSCSKYICEQNPLPINGIQASRCRLQASCSTCGNGICEMSDSGFINCPQDCHYPDNNFDAKIDDQEILLFLLNDLDIGEKQYAIQWWNSS